MAAVQLSDAEIAALRAVLQRLGVRRSKLEFGVAGDALASLLVGRASAGSVAIVRAKLPRVTGELAAHDTEARHG